MDARKKILLDLFAAPSTLLPLVGGLVLLVGGWAMGAGPAATLLGIVGTVAGLGMAAGRLIFRLEAITNRAYDYVRDQERKTQEKALNKLDHKLLRDRDPRTRSALRQVRHLYASLVDDVKAGKITLNTQDILQKVEDLFQACVAQLERSYQLWLTARTLPANARDPMLQEREHVVQEVVRSVEHLDRTIEQLRGFTGQTEEQELGRMRDELDEAIEVARRTEQRLASWDKKPYSEKDFE